MKKKLFITIFFLILIIIVWFFFFNKEKINIVNEEIKKITEDQYQKESLENKNEDDEFSIISVVADNLETPWSILKLPSGDLLLSEREGQIRLIKTSGESEIIYVIEEAKESGEGGLLGITSHPQFIDNNLIYLYYTYKGDRGVKLNKVVRASYENSNFTNFTTIIDNIPGALYHNGGRIKFGPDNNLYITTGDAQIPEKAQDINSLAGKILRLSEDGGVVENNPFNNEVYSYGHRNPQGISWDSDGNLWATEHGLSATDELNLIEKGSNYGWPVITGNEKKDNMLSPSIHSGVDETWAPSGAAYYDNSIFFVGLRGNTLYQANISDRDNVILTKHFSGEFGRLRDVIIDDQGIMYFISNNTDGRGEAAKNDDKLYRVDLERFLSDK